jgi:hypothetical protein
MADNPQSFFRFAARSFSPFSCVSTASRPPRFFRSIGPIWGNCGEELDGAARQNLGHQAARALNDIAQLIERIRQDSHSNREAIIGEEERRYPLPEATLVARPMRLEKSQ